jgi:hypothetical protein
MAWTRAHRWYDSAPAHLRAARQDARQFHLGYSSDAGQRLATKSQGRQRWQVVDRADLAGRKPLQRQSGILGMHATAVIRDLDETSPAIDQFNVNTRAPSIEGIVQEFLQYRSGALDDLPSRDAA